MNCYSLQQNAFAACEEMRGSVNIAADQKETLICPKPRRVGVLSNVPMRHLRWHFIQQTEGSDSKAGAELLDIMFKESQGEEFANQVASSPPYFCGSPPTRAANPLVHDARFGDENNTANIISAMSSSPSSGLASPTSASRKGGYVRTSFGLKPAAVRVEGFDCLNIRDRQNSSIPAVA